MRSFSPVLLIFSVAFFLLGCNHTAPVITDEAAYVEEIEAWQHQRLERLKDKNGWLSLAGLYWLEEGENSFGSDSSNKIVFPEKAEAFCGTLFLDGGNVTFRWQKGLKSR